MKKHVDKLNQENRELKEKVRFQRVFIIIIDKCNECPVTV